MTSKNVSLAPIAEVKSAIVLHNHLSQVAQCSEKSCEGQTSYTGRVVGATIFRLETR